MKVVDMCRCRRVRRQLGLLVGGDLDQPTSLAFRLHLRTCPRCAKAWRTASRVHEALLQAADEPATGAGAGTGLGADEQAGAERESLWPALRPMCNRGVSRRAPARGWLPAAAMAAACAATLLLAWLTPIDPRGPAGMRVRVGDGARGRTGTTYRPPRVPDNLVRSQPDTQRPNTHFLLDEAQLVQERRGNF